MVDENDAPVETAPDGTPAVKLPRGGFMHAVLPPTDYDPNLPLPDGFKQVADRALYVFNEAQTLYRELCTQGRYSFKERTELIIFLLDASLRVARTIAAKTRAPATSAVTPAGQPAVPIPTDEELNRMPIAERRRRAGLDA